MIPKGSTTLNFESDYAPCRLVMYEQDGSFLLGSILGSKKTGKFQIFNMREREVELPSNRLSALPGKLPSELSSRSEQARYLLRLYEQALDAAQQFNLEELWNFVNEDARTFSIEELVEQYFGSASLEQHLELRFALLGDRVFFKRKKNEFVPRTPETVQELQIAEQTRRSREELLDRTVIAFRQKKDKPVWPFPEEVLEHVHLLEQVAAGCAHLDNTNQKEAQLLIDRCSEELKLNIGGKREERAFALLEKIGHFHKNTNLSFIRHHLSPGFSEDALQEASQLPEIADFADLSPEEQKYRQDLTELHAITIDDETTQDMDDALSIERNEQGYRLGIHITDVASCIKPDSALDHQARKKATSVYCPEVNFNMLPEELAERKLSLIAGAARRCLSCMVQIDKDLKIQSYSFVPSLIRVKERLSYNQVEELLSSDYNFAESGPGAVHLLYSIAMGYEAERLGCGALKIPKRMVLIEVNDRNHLASSDFRIVEIDENGPSRSLIGEMMILANNLAAVYAEKHAIPFIYRSQEQPAAGDQKDLSQIPDGPARDYARRGNLKRSNTSLDPAPHATLGLDLYAQTTSPIRRYQDLCNQRQILGHLVRKEAYFTADQLKHILQETEEPLQKANQVTRETRKFWLYKYLKHKARRNEQIMATVVRIDMKHPLVELDEIYINAMLRSKQGLRLGQRIALKIASVDPRFDYLKLEVLSN